MADEDVEQFEDAQDGDIAIEELQPPAPTKVAGIRIREPPAPLSRRMPRASGTGPAAFSRGSMPGIAVAAASSSRSTAVASSHGTISSPIDDFVDATDGFFSPPNAPTTTATTASAAAFFSPQSSGSTSGGLPVGASGLADLPSPARAAAAAAAVASSAALPSAAWQQPPQPQGPALAPLPAGGLSSDVRGGLVAPRDDARNSAYLGIPALAEDDVYDRSEDDDGGGDGGRGGRGALQDAVDGAGASHSLRKHAVGSSAGGRASGSVRSSPPAGTGTGTGSLSGPPTGAASGTSAAARQLALARMRVAAANSNSSSGGAAASGGTGSNGSSSSAGGDRRGSTSSEARALTTAATAAAAAGAPTDESSAVSSSGAGSGTASGGRTSNSSSGIGSRLSGRFMRAFGAGVAAGGGGAEGSNGGSDNASGGGTAASGSGGDSRRSSSGGGGGSASGHSSRRATGGADTTAAPAAATGAPAPLSSLRPHVQGLRGSLPPPGAGTGGVRRRRRGSDNTSSSDEEGGNVSRHFHDATMATGAMRGSHLSTAAVDGTGALPRASSARFLFAAGAVTVGSAGSITPVGTPTTLAVTPGFPAPAANAGAAVRGSGAGTGGVANSIGGSGSSHSQYHHHPPQAVGSHSHYAPQQQQQQAAYEDPFEAAGIIGPSAHSLPHPPTAAGSGGGGVGRNASERGMGANGGLLPAASATAISSSPLDSSNPFDDDTQVTSIDTHTVAGPVSAAHAASGAMGTGIGIGGTGISNVKPTLPAVAAGSGLTGAAGRDGWTRGAGGASSSTSTAASASGSKAMPPPPPPRRVPSQGGTAAAAGNGGVAVNSGSQRVVTATGAASSGLVAPLQTGAAGGLGTSRHGMASLAAADAATGSALATGALRPDVSIALSHGAPLVRPTPRRPAAGSGSVSSSGASSVSSGAGGGLGPHDRFILSNFESARGGFPLDSRGSTGTGMTGGPASSASTSGGVSTSGFAASGPLALALPGSIDGGLAASSGGMPVDFGTGTGLDLLSVDGPSTAFGSSAAAAAGGVGGGKGKGKVGGDVDGSASGIGQGAGAAGSRLGSGGGSSTAIVVQQAPSPPTGAAARLWLATARYFGWEPPPLPAGLVVPHAVRKEIIECTRLALVQRLPHLSTAVVRARVARARARARARQAALAAAAAAADEPANSLSDSGGSSVRDDTSTASGGSRTGRLSGGPGGGGGGPGGGAGGGGPGGHYSRVPLSGSGRSTPSNHLGGAGGGGGTGGGAPSAAATAGGGAILGSGKDTDRSLAGTPSSGAQSTGTANSVRADSRAGLGAGAPAGGVGRSSAGTTATGRPLSRTGGGGGGGASSAVSHATPSSGQSSGLHAASGGAPTASAMSVDIPDTASIGSASISGLSTGSLPTTVVAAGGVPRSAAATAGAYYGRNGRLPATAPLTEAVWSMKWSMDGQYLAVAGGSESGSVIRVWRVKAFDRNYWTNAIGTGNGTGGTQSSSSSSVAAAVVGGTASGAPAVSPRGGIVPSRTSAFTPTSTAAAAATNAPGAAAASSAAPSPQPTAAAASGTAPAAPKLQRKPVVCHGAPVFESRPYREYLGHETHIVDIAWSRSNLLVSASMDSFVRLWHVSRPECLHKFQHPDCVTAVAFHPSEDNYFLTGCLDKKLRIWSLETGRVVMWHAMPSMVTSVAFSPDARLVAVGLYNGLVTLHRTDGLVYHTTLECRNRKGKHRRGRKVTGLEFTPLGAHLLVTTNDSRVRLFRMDDFAQVAKYAGLRNSNMQIRATFDATGERLVAGSEDKRVYVWRTRNDQMTNNANQKMALPGLTGDERLHGASSDSAITATGGMAATMDITTAAGSLPGVTAPSSSAMAGAFPVVTAGGVLQLHPPAPAGVSGAGAASSSAAAAASKQMAVASAAAAAGKCMKVRSCEWFAADDGLQPPAPTATGGEKANEPPTAAGAAASSAAPGTTANRSSSSSFLSWLCGCGGTAATTTSVASAPQAGGTTSAAAGSSAHPSTALAPQPAASASGSVQRGLPAASAAVSSGSGGSAYPTSGAPAVAGAVAAGGTVSAGPASAELDVDDLEDIVARAELNASLASGRTATTVALFAPPATLNICRPFHQLAQWKKPVTLPAEVHDHFPEDPEARRAFEAEVRSAHFIIVAADSRGFLRVYENTGPRFAAP